MNVKIKFIGGPHDGEEHEIYIGEIISDIHGVRMEKHLPKEICCECCNQRYIFTASGYGSWEYKIAREHDVSGRVIWRPL